MLTKKMQRIVTFFLYLFYFSCLLCLVSQLNSISVHSSASSVESQRNRCTPAYPKLNSLPGNGWCSLRNIEMNPVLSVTYNQCKVLETPNGNYLIPDHLHITSKSTSDVDTTQELIQSHQNYVSLTASSISASASGGFGRLTAQATFSDDYKNMKKTQFLNKAVTSRISGRYVLHGAEFDQYAVELHPDLKVKFSDAIDAIEQGQIKKASLILELALLSHGTHVITGIDLGGIIVKEDYISKAYVEDNVMKKHEMGVSASIGFADFFNAKCSFSKSDYASQYNEYVKNTKSTKIISHGGELIKSATLNISSWVESLPHYLVAVDRLGVALPYVVTTRHFPNTTRSTLSTLTRELLEAIKHFNDVNIHAGCMNQDSPNFDYNANIGSSCNDPPTNYTLGGIFQTCQCYGTDKCPECERRVVKNVFTGDTTCPQNFTKVYLNGKKSSGSREKCTWWRCDTYHIDYEYKAYWCAANVYPIPEKSGLMFGGLFTKTAVNPITGSQSCPPNFIHASILQDLTVCMTEDYEFGYKNSVPFGGFFSCRQGNPLASISLSNEKSTKLKITAVPSTCGHGYSQHTAAIDNDCLIGYCVKANSFGSGLNEIPIHLPPFQDYNGMFDEEELARIPVVLTESSIIAIVLGTLLAFVVVANVVFVIVKCIAGRKRAQDSERTSLVGNAALKGYQRIPDNGDGEA